MIETDPFPTKKQVLDDAIGQKIVDLINLCFCENKYEYAGWYDGNIKIKNARGTCGIIVCYKANNVAYFIRSILFPKNRFKAIRYLCNGQASTNAREIAFWPEGDCTYIYTDEEIKASLEMSFGENAEKVIAQGIIRDPYKTARASRGNADRLHLFPDQC